MQVLAEVKEVLKLISKIGTDTLINLVTYLLL